MTEERMQYFGEHWDAPTTDNADEIPVPTDEQCMTCEEFFQEGDQGLRFPSGFYQHKMCGLRAVLGGIGHLVDHDYYCQGALGTDAGLPVRDSACLVWEWYVNRARYTRDDLDIFRRVAQASADE